MAIRATVRISTRTMLPICVKTHRFALMHLAKWRTLQLRVQPRTGHGCRPYAWLTAFPAGPSRAVVGSAASFSRPGRPPRAPGHFGRASGPYLAFGQARPGHGLGGGCWAGVQVLYWKNSPVSRKGQEWHERTQNSATRCES